MNSPAKGRAMSPARFGELASGGRWAVKPHIELMNQRAMLLVSGRIDRHITLEPPQTGKSEFWSLWFPTWLIGSFPETRVILGSYNSDYAAEWGEKVRDCLKEHGPDYFGVTVSPTHSARESWGVLDIATNQPCRGGMRTAGMDSGITGRPADAFLVDDPFKGYNEAASPATREKVWRTFTTCVTTRLQPNSFISIVMTPWHEDDLCGRLLAKQPEEWPVLRMPALAEEPIPAEVRATRKGYYALMGAPDPLGRPPGKALWPARYDEAHYARVKKLEARDFSALYQCTPRPDDGVMFKREWFEGKDGVGSRISPVAPTGGHYVRYWDKAASEGKGDYTCGALLMVKDGVVWILDVLRERLEPGPRDALIRQTCVTDNKLYPGIVTWGEHAGNDAKESASNFIKNLRGFAAFTEGTGNKDKITRAYPFASYCQSGNVYLKAGHWNEAFIDELCVFPNGGRGEHDDQVDAAAGAFGKLALEAEHGEAGVWTPGKDEDLVGAIEPEGVAW